MACLKALSTVACSFQFTNNANEDLYILKWNTPLEGLRSPFITVTLNKNNMIPYKGIIVYRLSPAKENFALLKAGETISATIQITDAFKIDTDGLYNIQYNNPIQYLPVDDMSLMSNTREATAHESVNIYLENAHLLLKPKKLESKKVDYTIHLQACGSASFSNGDKNNSVTLEAHKKLCSGLDKAEDNIGYNDVYQRWFGTYTPSRASTVRRTFENTRTGLETRAVTYYNDGPECQPSEAAYTHPSYWQTTVYLCGPFYGLSTNCNGTGDTKERILAHEWTHALANRADEEYGVEKCKEIARSAPDRAVNNADSYSYHYCESQ